MPVFIYGIAVIDKDAALANFNFEGFYQQELGSPISRSGDWVTFHCPFDKHKGRPFAINRSHGGWRCQSCDRAGDIFNWLEEMRGMDFKEAIAFIAGDQLQVEETWVEHKYVDNGAVRYTKSRAIDANGKTAKWSDGNKKMKWSGRKKGDPWILYNLDQVRGSDHVIVVEGEKCADILSEFIDYKMAVTTLPHGKGMKIDNEILEPLVGKKVWIQPDGGADEYASAIAEWLSRHGTYAYITHLPDLSENEDIEEWIKRGGTKDELRKLLINSPQYGSDSDSCLFETVDDATEDKVGRMEWVLEDLFNKGGCFTLSAAQKTGKSYLVLQMGMSVACGKKFLSFRAPKPSKVLYVQKEIGEIPLKRRISMFQEELFHDRQQLLKENFLFRKDASQLKLDQNPEWLEEYVSMTNAELIILDPLSRFLVGDLNKQQEILPVFDYIQSVSHKYNCAILLVHHTRKDTDGTNVFDAIRGSKSIVESTDGNIAMQEVAEKNIPEQLVRMRMVRKLYFQMRNVEQLDPMIIYAREDGVEALLYNSDPMGALTEESRLETILSYIMDNPEHSTTEITKGIDKWSRWTVTRLLTKAKDRGFVTCKRIKNKLCWYIN